MGSALELLEERPIAGLFAWQLGSAQHEFVNPKLWGHCLVSWYGNPVLEKLYCIGFIWLAAVVIWLYGLYHVKVRGQKLRRTANLDIGLIRADPSKRESLDRALNCFIMIEAAFASVTSGVLFVFLGLFSTGALHLEPIDNSIAQAAAFGLSIATVSWVLSLEELSHLVSPSLPPRVFENLYKEAFNLWNLGLMLLVFSICCVLVLVNPLVAFSVTAVSAVLCLRTLYLVHGWDDNGRTNHEEAERKRAKVGELFLMVRQHIFQIRAGLTITLALLVLFLFPLYEPLNVPRAPLHSLRTAFDVWLPLVPIFAIPYVSYFVFLLATTLLLITFGIDEISIGFCCRSSWSLQSATASTVSSRPSFSGPT